VTDTLRRDLMSLHEQAQLVEAFEALPPFPEDTFAAYASWRDRAIPNTRRPKPTAPPKRKRL
jgi:hypothetical protein